MKLLTVMTLLVLFFSGIRAPEMRMNSRGICFQGATLEKTADTSPLEWHEKSTHPLLLHAGFAPAAHPFDLPETLNETRLIFSSHDQSLPHFSLKEEFLSSPERPPIHFPSLTF